MEDELLFSETGVHIGILFHGFVVLIVALIALAFLFFLFRRWSRLDEAMHAYGWFWMFTFLVWVGISIRYFMIGGGWWDFSINANEVFVQTAVFFTGPPLFYYAGLRVFKNQFVAGVLGSFSLIMGFNAIVFVMQPGGLVRSDATNFTADTILNHTSQILFSFQIFILVLLFLYDIVSRLIAWRRAREATLFYNALYSLVLVIYVALGGIDNSHIIVGWPLVIFRLLYAGTFLFGYILITKEDAAGENYLIPDEGPHAQLVEGSGGATV